MATSTASTTCRTKVSRRQTDHIRPTCDVYVSLTTRCCGSQTDLVTNLHEPVAQLGCYVTGVLKPRRDFNYTYSVWRHMAPSAQR